MASSFSDLGVPARLVARLAQRGVTAPFPIQAATVPDALAGRDVCGKAPTGSGKTLAFGLALIARATGSAPRRPRGLVLVPTRELASQVRDELALLTENRGQRIIAIYGGTGYGPSRRALDKGVDIVVACPGRLMDLVEQGALHLNEVTIAVLDEADRMADMGFLPAVRKLLDDTAPDRQVLLFSATIGNEVESVIRQYQRDPVRHDVVGDESSAGDVSHVFWHADRADRIGLIAKLVAEHGQTLVFCRTKRGADRVARQLGAVGVQAVAIHGDRTQGQRERALATFSNGKAHALVATDVAARGIHINDLPCVVHFDLPADPTDYVHRSGRTGRAGNNGTVVSLVTDEQNSAARGLQRALGLPSEIVAPGATTGTTVATALRPITTSPASPSGGRHVAGPAPSGSRPGAKRRTGRNVNGRRGSGPAGTSANTGRIGHDADAPAATTFVPLSASTSMGGAAGSSTRTNPETPNAVPKARERRGIMPIGTVKFFNTEKGYGFVSRPDGEDVFVHYSNVEGSGFRTLEAGQQVEFEIAPGRKGDEARNVKVI